MGRKQRSAGVLSWQSLLHLILTVEIAVCADVLTALLAVNVPVAVFYIAAIALWALMNRLNRVRGMRLACLCMALPCALLLCGALTFGVWSAVAPRWRYAADDVGKDSLYGGQTVMIVVPHEDDDFNLAGGVIEEYVKYGSEVYTVFLTNGDYYGIGETRINEAIREAALLGLPEDHVIFLGYGDRWRSGGPHIYNAEPDAQMTSATGRTETYGTAEHPAYRNGRAYTNGNLLSDMKDVLLEYRPDTILCCDYDSHIDHRATGLVFERALGQILREQPGYSPAVLKGFAYATAFTAEADYLSLNMLSATDIYGEPPLQRPQIYEWEDRIRLPVDSSNLSRSLFASKGLRSMAVYASQRFIWESASVLNGDKVFWHRRTDSLCYGASVSASSGEANRLTDFLLLDTDDLLNSGDEPYDGTWTPDARDDRRTITVEFDQPRDIREIVLYDNPSPEDNVLDAVIRFDDGTSLATGALNPDGSESAYAVDRENVSSFEIVIRESEGERAGFTEIEAYSSPRQALAPYVKLMDGGANFVYDYITPDRSGEADLFLYRYGECDALDESSYDVAWDDPECSAEIIGDRVHVKCPAGRAFSLAVTSVRDDAVADCVTVRNPGGSERAVIRAMQRLEQFVYDLYNHPVLKRTIAFKTFTGLRSGLRNLRRR